MPPIRQTASIFKQPVTVIKTQEGKVKSDLKHGSQEKPKQLFWEKRLEVWRVSNVLCNLEYFFSIIEFPSLRQRRDWIYINWSAEATEASRATRKGSNTFPIGCHCTSLIHASGDWTNVIEDNAQHQSGCVRQSRPTFALRLLNHRRRHQKARRSGSAGAKEVAGSSR